MATSTKPPTSLLGHVDQWSQWSTIVNDLTETVGDVVWPTSVWTYTQMRKDPRLAAIEAAYSLPIRRASWAIDPAGCRDEVVQVVADDLGLPILGAEDRPGPARMRGVSWRDHIRMVQLNLVYGHMGFELQAEIRDGLARLTMLAERMPASISEIHVDPKSGAFTGISQWSAKTSNRDVPDIAASRMAWYAHDREGTQWQGHSLIRPAYAPWLLKREMQRVLATSNRRFGMGVPTVRWLPGSTPTPAQHAAAQQVAENMRVGDQAGAALPPGAIIELIGLSGSVPNTQGFMDWLNAEMAMSTLTQWMDLGRTETGSRALGETFVSQFMLSTQAVADEEADTATRQIAGRIVSWNWGDTEPVPRVTVADIGSRHEVTAEALGLLLQSGALSADPALEEYVRSEFGLPQRSTPAPAPQPPANPAPPVAAGGPRDRTADIVGYVAARPAGVRAAEIEKEFGSTARKTLARLVTAGKLTRVARGIYAPKADTRAKYNPGQKRDPDGQFSDGVFDADVDEGDEDEFGNSSLPAAYLEKYGHVVGEERIDGTEYAVAITDKRSLHVAQGHESRKVLTEVTPSQAHSLSEALGEAVDSDEDGITTDEASGVAIARTGTEYQLTWPDGATTDLDSSDQASDLAESLRNMANTYVDEFGEDATSLVGRAKRKQLPPKVDKLKLNARAELADGEELRASRKLPASEYGETQVLGAAVSTPDGPEVRVGIAAHGDEQKWNAGEDGRTLKLAPADIDRIVAAIDTENKAGKARSTWLQKQWEELEQLDDAKDSGDLDEAGLARLAELDAWNQKYEVDDKISEGVVSAGAWGDFAYEVWGEDDQEGGWKFQVAVKPPDAGADWKFPETWDDNNELSMVAELSAAEMKKFLKGLGTLKDLADAQPVAARARRRTGVHGGSRRRAAKRRPARARTYTRDGHGQFSESPGLDGEVLDADDYLTAYGGDYDERSLGEELPTVRVFDSGRAHLVWDHGKDLHEPIVEFDGPDDMRTAADGLQRMSAIDVPEDADPSDGLVDQVDLGGGWAAGVDAAGNVGIYALNLDGDIDADEVPVAEMDQQQAYDLGDAIYEMANSADDVLDATEVDASPSARRRRRPRRRANARRRVPKAAVGTSGQSGQRDLTEEELASGVDLAAIQAAWTASHEQLLAELPTLAEPIRDELGEQVVAAIEAGDLAALGALTASSAALATAIAAVMQSTATVSAAGVEAEAAAQGVAFTAPVVELAAVTGIAAAIAGVIVGGLASAAARSALQVAGPTAAPAEVGQVVADAIDAMVASPTGWIADNLAQAVTVAQATGRGVALEAAPEALVYIACEVMDRNTCDPCYDVDGKRFANLAMAQAEYALGGYANCDGGLRCRGIIIARWES